MALEVFSASGFTKPGTVLKYRLIVLGSVLIPHPTLVNLGKIVNLSEILFSHLQNDGSIIYHIGFGVG